MNLSRRTSLTVLLATLMVSSISAGQGPTTAGVSRVSVDEYSMRGAEMESAPPHYPVSSVARGASGVVVASILVTRSGRVTDIVIEKAPDEPIAEAVRTAVALWRYRPVEVGWRTERHAVDTETKVTFSFVISADGYASVTRQAASNRR